MIGYIAKDKNGEIYLHREAPVYDEDLDGWFSSPDTVSITGQFPEFENISYTDDPVKVELNLKRI